MLTMFPVEKLLETITRKPKTPITKLQRSPKIIGYPRDDYCELNEPLLSYEDTIDCGLQGKITKGVVCNKDNQNIRVKVLLTKDEAAKLLAKCKGEGATLDFKDVVMELGKLPAQRIDVSVTKITTQSKDLELATILEEDEEDEEHDEYYKKIQ